MGRKRIDGICHICGCHGKLSYEHVPPRAAFTLRMTNRVPCTCDSDCETGLTCVVPEDPELPRICERRCGTASALWCGGGHWCAPAAMDVAAIANVDSVCGWVGD